VAGEHADLEVRDFGLAAGGLHARGLEVREVLVHELVGVDEAGHLLGRLLARDELLNSLSQ